MSGIDRKASQDMTLNELKWACWEAAERKGFHDGRSQCGRDHTLIRLCLIHSEVSEAVQVVKRYWEEPPERGQNATALESFGEEIADVFIRLFDLAGCVGIDLDAAVKTKLEKNTRRPHMYGTPTEAK